MPLNQAFDYSLNSKPFMLWRDGPFKGRSWRRSGEISVPGFQTTRTEQGIENFPDQIEFSEVWDDWSGGYGFAYRTQENPNTYHWGENFDPRFPGQIVHCQQLSLLAAGAAAASTNQNCEWFMDVPLPQAGGVGPAKPRLPGQGAVLAVGLSYFARFSPSGPAANQIGQYANTPAVTSFGGRPALYGSQGYVGNLSASPFWWFDQFNSSTFSDLSVSPNYGTNFVVAGNRLWRSFGNGGGKNFHLQSIGNPDLSAVASLSNWSATLAIGDGAAPINDLIALNDQVFCGTPKGLLAGDQSGTFVNVMPDLGNVVDYENCRDLAIFQGSVVAQSVSGVFSYYPSTMTAIVREITPVVLDSNRAPITGYVRALKGYSAWLYAGMFTGSSSYLLAGRDTGERFIWHTLQKLPHTAKVHRIHFDSISRTPANVAVPQRMWVATDATFPTSGTAPVYVSPIPKLNGDPLADTAFSANYVGSARMDLGSIDRGAPGAAKLARRVEVWAESMLSGAQYADVYYTLDRGTRTLLGRAQTSPVSYLYFPSTQGSFSLWRQLELSIESFTASQNVTPVYRSVVLRGAILADVVDVISAQTRISDSVVDRNGGKMRPGAQQIQDLRDFASPSYGPVVLQDLLGNTQLVKVLPPVEETEVWQDGNLPPEISAGVRMAVLSFTGP